MPIGNQLANYFTTVNKGPAYIKAFVRLFLKENKIEKEKDRIPMSLVRSKDAGNDKYINKLERRKTAMT